MNQYCWWETLGNLASYDTVLCSAAPATDTDKKRLCELPCFFDLGLLSLCQGRFATAVFHSAPFEGKHKSLMELSALCKKLFVKIILKVVKLK